MDKLLNYFKILSDETRLRIIILLAHGDFCVCQLTGITGISQPNISKHLARLRDLDLVRDQKKDQYTFYSLKSQDPVFLALIQAVIDRLSDYPCLELDLAKTKAAAKFIELAKQNNL